MKVIRGCNYRDEETLVCRNQVRNFRGRGAEGPPLPQNRYETVGFRLAWSPEAGADQIGPTMRRIKRGKLVGDEDVRADLYGGATMNQFAASTEAVTAAEAQLKLANARYAQGLGSQIELADAQYVVTEAQGNLISAEWQLADAWARLRRALGRG